MYLSALRLLQSLSGYQYRTVIITVLLPAIGPPIIAYFGPEFLVLRFILYAAAFLVWSVFAVLAVASMLNRDKSEAEQLADQKLESLSEQFGRLREGHDDLRLDFRRQLNDLEEVVRSTLSDRLGVVLPPRPISIRAKIKSGVPIVSATGTGVGGSKLARLRRWFRRAVHRLKEVVYGKPEDD